MSRRWRYGFMCLGLLAIELVIGLWVRDNFVRPYVGDVLAAVLLCCLWRFLFLGDSKWLPLGIFFGCAAVEGIQLLELPRRFGFEGTFWAVLLGSTFDWKDLICYGIGCALFSQLQARIRK